MRQSLVRAVLMAGLVSAGAACAQPTSGNPANALSKSDEMLRAAIGSSARTAANVARDRYRHPAETLAFFGIKPGDTVVEIWPGGGWYSEILAPYLIGGGGTYYAAGPSERGLAAVEKLRASNPNYQAVKTTIFPAPAGQAIVPNGTADVVLTFRNIHNWMGSEGASPMVPEAFRQMYAMLKPGGTLGVVEHRLPEDADIAREAKSGYVRTSTVRRLAEDAGFRFVGASEVNANPKDTKDYPNGVWTLPPSYQLKDVDRAKYEAIGESDRMTLKFVKPS